MGILFSLITAMFYALTNIYNRKAAKDVKGLDAITISAFLNFIFFFPLTIFIKWAQGTPWPDFISIILYAMVGVFTVFLGRWGLYTTISLIGPSRASIMKNSAPAFTIVLAFIFFQRLPSFLPLFGIFFILIGIWLLGSEKGEETTNAIMRKKGIRLGIVVGMIFSGSDIFRSFSMHRAPDIILATGISILGGFISIVLFSLFQGNLRSTFMSKSVFLNKNLILSSITAGFAVITNFIAVYYLFVPYVSALVATAPIFTALFSRLLSRYDEEFGSSFWVTLGLVIFGAIFISVFS